MAISQIDQKNGDLLEGTLTADDEQVPTYPWWHWLWPSVAWVPGQNTLQADFGPMGTEADLLGWLAAANLELTGKGCSGLYMFFEARRNQAS